MSKKTGNVPQHSLTVSEASQRIKYMRGVLQVSLIAFIVFLGIYIAATLFFPEFPLGLIIVDVVAIGLMVLCYGLLNLEKYDLVANVYLISVSLILFAALYFTGGTRGPMALALPVVALIAAALAERKIAIITAVSNALFYIVGLVGENFGFTPYEMPPFITTLLWGGIFVTATAILLTVNEQFTAFIREALDSQKAHSQELVLATQRAEAAVKAERDLRQKDVIGKQHLDMALEQYLTFLEQVRVGDYETRLDMDSLATHKDLPLTLLNLGRYLNMTVESLVQALTEVQEVQRVYVQQSWESLIAAGEESQGYRLRRDAKKVELSNSVWLEPMTQAVQSRNATVLEGALAVPMETRGQIIGALGVQRGSDEPWSSEQLEIVNAVVDQLAQTIENLRLLGESSRRAAREQSIAEVTAEIRTETVIEDVLERALVELGRVLSAERGAAHLTLGQQQEPTP